MTTLVTSHDGLNRMVRGVRAVADLFGGNMARPARPSRFASFVSRMIARAQQHRQDRLFEQLMRDDPAFTRTCRQLPRARTSSADPFAAVTRSPPSPCLLLHSRSGFGPRISRALFFLQQCFAVN